MTQIDYNISTSVRHPVMGENVLWAYMKQCSQCEELKPLTMFPKRVAIDNGQKAQCKACMAIYKNSLYMKDHEHQKDLRKAHYRSKQEYYQTKARQHYRETCVESNLNRRCKKRGITRDQFFEMLNLQDHKCTICGNKFSGRKDCAIDHCHITGKVRSLLCDNCNTMLGLAKESKETFLRAIQYLDKYKK